MILQLLGGVRAAIFLGLFGAASVWGGYQYLRAERLVTAIERVETRALAKERSYQNTIRGIVYDYHVEKDAREEYVSQLQRDVASGQLRLKQRFSCPAAPAGSDGGEERGLRAEDGGFLIGEAARADEIARQLQLAQETIRQYQELNRGKR